MRDHLASYQVYPEAISRRIEHGQVVESASEVYVRMPPGDMQQNLTAMRDAGFTVYPQVASGDLVGNGEPYSTVLPVVDRMSDKRTTVYVAGLRKPWPTDAEALKKMILSRCTKCGLTNIELKHGKESQTKGPFAFFVFDSISNAEAVYGACVLQKLSIDICLASFAAQLYASIR